MKCFIWLFFMLCFCTQACKNNTRYANTKLFADKMKDGDISGMSNMLVHNSIRKNDYEGNNFYAIAFQKAVQKYGVERESNWKVSIDSSNVYLSFYIVKVPFKTLSSDTYGLSVYFDAKGVNLGDSILTYRLELPYGNGLK